MNNKCPTCGANYNISEQHIGRTFTCQKCQSPLVVAQDGLQLAGVQPGGQVEAYAGAHDEYGDYDDRAYTGRRQGGDSSAFVDFLMFRRMIVPILIHILFWLMFAGVTLGLLVAFLRLMGALGILLFIFAWPFAILYVRVICEMIFLPFRMNETLTEILNELKRQG